MNFKPKIKYNTKLISKLKINYLYCKNFIFILLLIENLKLFNKSKINNNTLKLKYFIEKKNYTLGSTIRAPYKNKKAQFNLKILRYFLVIIFKFNFNDNIIINNNNQVKNLIDRNIKTYNYFESTLITQVSRKFVIPFKSTIIKY